MLIFSWNGLILTTGLCSIAGFYQFMHQCPTCPHITFLGVPAGLAGSIVYGALFLVVLGRFASVILGVPLICSAIASWQIGQLLGGAESCTPCEIIFLLNFAILGSALARKWKLPTSPTLPLEMRSPQVAIPVCLLLFVLIGLAAIKPGIAKQPKVGRLSPQSWVGSKLAIKFPTLGLNQFTGIVLFWKEGCYPCDLARQSFRSE